jgi:hypothetical protein
MYSVNFLALRCLRDEPKWLSSVMPPMKKGHRRRLCGTSPCSHRGVGQRAAQRRTSSVRSSSFSAAISSRSSEVITRVPWRSNFDKSCYRRVADRPSSRGLNYKSSDGERPMSQTLSSSRLCAFTYSSLVPGAGLIAGLPPCDHFRLGRARTREEQRLCLRPFER